MSAQIDTLAKILWQYHHMHHELQKADCILVLGSHDIRIAEYGAKLLLDGWAPCIVFSGGFGRLTKQIWSEPEADTFARIAIQMGVPREKIIVENKSSNTGENILFTKQLFQQKELDPQKFILVHKPYMERRAYATFSKLWPEKECIVTSPQISFDEYPNRWRSKEDIINIIVGDLQRVQLYPEKGFQIPQEIPKDVWNAFQELVKLGYSKDLVS